MKFSLQISLNFFSAETVPKKKANLKSNMKQTRKGAKKIVKIVLPTDAQNYGNQDQGIKGFAFKLIN